jgi:predicted Rossmann fold nucleotide-binding protein DprA/Smf involved in DNA uptake
LPANERTAYLFLALLQARVGSSLISRLADLPPAAILEAPLAELSGRMALSRKAAQGLEELRRNFDPEAVNGALSKMGISALTLVDAGYPERLKEIPAPRPPSSRKGRSRRPPPLL